MGKKKKNLTFGESMPFFIAAVKGRNVQNQKSGYDALIEMALLADVGVELIEMCVNEAIYGIDGYTLPLKKVDKILKRLRKSGLLKTDARKHTRGGKK